MLTFWQDVAERILFAVMRDENSGCVVYEVVEVEEIYPVLQ